MQSIMEARNSKREREREREGGREGNNRLKIIKKMVVLCLSRWGPGLNKQDQHSLTSKF